MNREMIHRLKVAGEYQKKAIRALFPEEMSGHLDIIENEIKVMIMELATELVKEYSTAENCDKEKNCEKQKSETGCNVKKVNIV